MKDLTTIRAKPIMVLKLTTLAVRRLNRMHIHTVGDLIDFKKCNRLTEIPYIGE